MKKIILLFSLLLFFAGCGNTTKTTEVVDDISKTTKTNVDIVINTKTGKDNLLELSFNTEASIYKCEWYVNDLFISNDELTFLEISPEHKTYAISLLIEDEDGLFLHASKNIDVKTPIAPTTPISVPTQDDTFSSIHYLIENAHVHNTTYICYGDSTRSYSEYNNHHVFENIQDALIPYGVSSINKSVTGISAKDASRSSFTYTNWSDIRDMISGDGKTTIVDISLGINDDESSDSQLKHNLKNIILSIRETKPNTHFILTVPSRTFYNTTYKSERFITIYSELSNELNIPYINVPDEAMPLDQLTLDWYRPGDQTHLTQESQRKISNLILSTILP